MSRFQKQFASIIERHFADRPRPKEADAPERYILRGEPTQFAKIKPGSLIGWGHDLCAALPDPRRLEAEDNRAIQVIALACGDFALGRWLKGHLETETTGEDLYGAVRAALREQPRTAAIVLSWTGQSVSCCEYEDRVTSAGRFLLALPEPDLGAVVKHSGSYQEANPGARLALLEFLFTHCPERIPALGANLFAKAGDTVNAEVVELLLNRAGPACESVVAAFAEKTKDLWARFAAMSKLAERDPKKYYPAAERAGLGILGGKSNAFAPGHYGPVATWLLTHGGDAVVPKVAACMTTPIPGAVAFDEVLPAAVETLGRGALPIVRASLQRDEYMDPSGIVCPPFQHMFPRLKQLLPIKESGDDDLIVRKLRLLLAGDDCGWDQATEFAVATAIPAVIDLVWGLAEHPSRPVRNAAATALAHLGDAAVPWAEALLRHRKADAREVAVRVLSAIATPRARAALRAHLAEEGAAKLCALIRAALPEAKPDAAARAPRKR